LNWELAAFVGTVVIQALVGAFVYGKLTQASTTHEKRLDEHDDRFAGHDAKFDEYGDKIGDLAVKTGKLESWRDGYNAATIRASHETQ
jgi:hypothetical protein